MTDREGGHSIVVRAVTKSYAVGDTHRAVLVGAHLAVSAGELVVLTGRSGSGKTTLLSILVGWDRPDSGSVELLGSRQPDELSWAELALVPQSLGLLEELTLIENITMPTRLDASIATDDASLDALVDRLGLAHLVERLPDEVSLGEQQRAALARAILARPRILIADEPIAHQNAAWAEVMMRLVDDLRADGAACLLATHNEVAFASADRIVELRDGTLVDR